MARTAPNADMHRIQGNVLYRLFRTKMCHATLGFKNCTPSLQGIDPQGTVAVQPQCWPWVWDMFGELGLPWVWLRGFPASRLKMAEVCGGGSSAIVPLLPQTGRVACFRGGLMPQGPWGNN